MTVKLQVANLLRGVGLAVGLLLALACGGGGSPGPLPDSFRSVVVSAGSINANGTDYPYQLLRLERDGKAPAFAQWFPHPAGTDAPAVLLTDPYGGITWNGDVPPVGADLLRPPRRVFDDAQIYLINGFSVINVFGRFYTGGDIQNEVDDMVAGLQFLARTPHVMKDRVAITGGSWGGFESLFAAADAPGNLIPRVGVALYPVSDVARLIEYVHTVIPTITDEAKRQQYVQFFAPYEARAYAATQGDYTHWTRASLLSRLRTPFLVVHDAWDTLIPFQHTFDLVAQSGGLVQGAWFHQDTPLDLNALPYGTGHGPLQVQDSTGTAYSMPMYLTLSLSYLMKGIALPEQSLINAYDPDALNAYVAHLKACKDRGVDMEWAAPRLLDLADPRVYLFNMDDPGNPALVRKGEAEVARVLNETWGTSLNETTVRGALAKGLPPYP